MIERISARSEFRARGFLDREYFEHRVVQIRKSYPDTLLAMRQRGVPPQVIERGDCVQVNIYSDRIEGLPRELFWHRELNWHEQQFGLEGLIAAIGLFLPTAEHGVISWIQSDLLQQLHRHPQFRHCKTQIEKRFRYWYRIALNAALDFARQQGCRRLYCPTSATILKNTKSTVDTSLFRRVYDAPTKHYAYQHSQWYTADYWILEVDENERRIARLDSVRRALPEANIICVYHDLKENVDTTSVDHCRQHLSRMLEIECTRGVNATYGIPGKLFESKAPIIRAAGKHSVAFHSFDHQLGHHQLHQLREADLRVKGYILPDSNVTPELSDYRLSFLNFEWLTRSRRSPGFERCQLSRGIAKIPISSDDHALHTGQFSYSDWKRWVVNDVKQCSFFAIGLHDCYAQHWLEHYDELLAWLSEYGEFWTGDEVASRLFLESSESFAREPI